MKKLYRVSSMLRTVYLYGQFYDKVKVTWFRIDRKRPIVRPEEGFWDYKPENEIDEFLYQEALNELFTEEEMKALLKYLSKFKELTSSYAEEVDLPMFASYGFRFALDQCSTHRLYNRLEPAASKTSYWGAPPFEFQGYYEVYEIEPRKPHICPTCERQIWDEAEMNAYFI